MKVLVPRPTIDGKYLTISASEIPVAWRAVGAAPRVSGGTCLFWMRATDTLRGMVQDDGALAARGIRPWGVRAAIVLISLAACWPTFRFGWALLDDGTVLTVSSGPLTWAPQGDREAGRYRPLYWLWYSAQYHLFGLEAGWFYLAQAAALAAGNLLVFEILRRLTGRGSLALLGAGLSLVASPVPESYYTLHKPEPLQTLCLLLATYALVCAWSWAEGRSALGRRWWMGLGTLFLFAAYLTKETTVLVLLATVPCVVVGVIHCWLNRGRDLLRLSLGVLAANAACLLAYIVLAYGVQGAAMPWAGQYTGPQMSGASPLDSLLQYARQAPDVIVPLALVAVLGIVGLLWRVGCWSPAASLATLLSSFLAALAGCYLFVWKWALVYYLLPLAPFGALAALLWLDVLSRRQARPGRMGWWVAAPVAVMVLIHLLALPQTYNSAAGLVRWNRVNGRLIRTVQKLPPDAAVLMSTAADRGYLIEMRNLLRLTTGRDDVRLGSVFDPVDWVQLARQGTIVLLNYGDAGNIYAGGRMLNMPPFEAVWTEMESLVPNPRLSELADWQRQATILEPWRFRPVRFSLGWTMYRLDETPETIADRYGGGWIGPETRLWIGPNGPATRLRLLGYAVETKSMKMPLTVGIWLGEEQVGKVRLEQAGEFERMVDLRAALERWKTAGETAQNRPASGPAKTATTGAGAGDRTFLPLRLVSDRWFVPAEDLGNSDTRRLSLLLRSARLAEASEYWADHWMGREARFDVPSATPPRRLQITGRAADVKSLHWPLRLSVWLEGRRLGDCLVAHPGDFQWTVDLSKLPSPPGAGVLRLTLMAEDSFVPRNEWPDSTDARELSVMIDEIRASGGE